MSSLLAKSRWLDIVAAVAASVSLGLLLYWPIRTSLATNAMAIQMVKSGSADARAIANIDCASPSVTSDLQLSDELHLEARLLVQKGHQMLLAGDCLGASRSWEQALVLDEKDVPTRLLLGIVYYWLGWPEKTHTLYRSLEASDRADWCESITRLSSLASSEGQRLEWLRLAFWVYPSRPAVRRLEENLPSAGRETELQFYLGMLVELAPSDLSDHWWAKGQLAGRAREWEDAIESYLQGLDYATDPDERKWLYMGAALGYRMLGNSACYLFLERMALTDGENVVPVEECLSR